MSTKKNLAELMKCQLDNWMTEFDTLAKIHQEDNNALEDLKQGLESSWAVLEKTLGSRE